MVTAAEIRQVEKLEESLSSRDAGGGAAARGGGDFQVKLEYLQLVNKLKLRRPAIVALHGLDLLNDKAWRNRLGSEVWSVYEQVAVAAMDCHKLDIAKECIGALMLKFPDSLRVGKLEGMWLEAKGWWEQAGRAYAGMLEDNPQDQQLHKRRVSVAKSQGNLLQAVSSLTAYLDTFMADYEAWRELGDLYIQLQMYRQAAFCYEELLLSSPHNPLYNLIYAEVLYTLGGTENFTTAKKYFTAAVATSGGKNIRALYGIALCSSALEQSGHSRASSSSENQRLQDGVEAADGRLATDFSRLASTVLQQEYRKKNPAMADIVAAAL
eukprot:TRINITY_DN14840_c0_g1_i1.p1 TRINITY_DN14840_c0_g1~~TRINITY_DN14840_c0_g1_i1.p1  ORF type:complete len:349 (+),score=102.02 TRINITY_DN14840_c0_g1_i1:78-1049(+)